MTTPARPLLSMVIAARNDSYMGDYKWRLQTCLDYMARNLVALGRAEETEILVCDWNSEVPLARVLRLGEEARRLVRFLVVPPSVAVPAQGKSAFPGSLAVNTAVRRARGAFIGWTNADVMFPPSVLAAMFAAIEGKLPLGAAPEEAAFLCSRRHLWNTIVRHRPTLAELEGYLARNRSLLPKDHFMPGMGAPSELFLLHRDVWAGTRGPDETMLDWGWVDVELHMRLTQRHPWFDLANFGGELVHMEHYSGALGREAGPPRKLNPTTVCPRYAANGEDWGLGDRPLEVQAAELAAEEAAPPDGELPAWTATPAEMAREMVAREVSALVDKVLEPCRNVEHELAALIALAWFARKYTPRVFVEVGARLPTGGAVVAKGHPGVELYGIDTWTPGGARLEAPLFSTGRLLHYQGGFSGYCRFVSGVATTAVQRLLDGPGAPTRLDLALVRCQPAFGSPTENVRRLVERLSPGGMLVVVGYSAEILAAVRQVVRQARPDYVWVDMADTQHTALIVAAREVRP